MLTLIGISCVLCVLFLDRQWRRYDNGIRAIRESLARRCCTNVRVDADWLDFGKVREYVVKYRDATDHPTRNMCWVNVNTGKVLAWFDNIHRAEQLSRRYNF